MRAKHKALDRKFENIDKKIEDNKLRKKMYTIKHREIDNLRFNDFVELRANHKNKGFKDKCDIVEKHIGMSIQINERKQ